MKHRDGVSAARRNVLGIIFFVIASVLVEAVLLFVLLQSNRIGIDRLHAGQLQSRRVETVAYLIERLHANPNDDHVIANLTVMVSEMRSAYASFVSHQELLLPSVNGSIVDSWRDAVKNYADAAAAFASSPRDSRRYIATQTAFFDARAKLQPLLEERSDAIMHRTAVLIAAIIFIGLLLLVACALTWWAVYLPTERREKKNIDALRESRRRFRALFEHNPDAVVMLDEDGAVEALNDSAVQFFRCSAEQFTGRRLADTIVGEDQRAQASALRHALGGEGAEFDSRFVAFDGTTREALVTLSPILIAGKPCGAYAIFKDISDMKVAEAALVRSERRFRSMFEQHSDGIAAITREGRYSRINTAFERISGYPGEELIGATPAKIIAPEDVETVYESLAKALEGNVAEYETTIVRKDGTRRQALVKSTPIVTDGIIDGIYSLVTDITERRELEANAEEQARRIRSLYELASTRSTARKEIERTIQFGAHSLEMDSAQVMRDGGDATFGIYATVDGGSLKAGETIAFERTIGAQALLKDQPVWIDDARSGMWSSHPIHEAFQIHAFIAVPIHVNGVPWGVLSFTSKGPRRLPLRDTDIDFVQLMAAKIGVSLERELRQEELSAMAFYDSLTGLPNRTLFLEHAGKALSRSRRDGSLVAFHYLDLDGFKAINDRYGHSAGDEVLREVARRLSFVIRDSDIVARLAGDEFVFVQNGVISEADALALARRVTHALGEPYELAGCTVQTGASIGISISPADGSDVETLLKRADAALYQVKSHGKNGAELYAC